MLATNIHWSSLLFVPAHQQRFIESSIKRQADLVILDLEDSVPQTEKAQARNKLLQQIQFLNEHNTDVAIRINRDWLNAAEDLKVAVTNGVKALVIPKVNSGDHLHLLEETINQLERQQSITTGSIGLIPMVESLESLSQLENIASATQRVIGLALGSEDLSLDSGFDATEDNLFYPAQQIVFAAKKSNVHAYGFPGSIANFSDLDSFSKQQKRAKSMGFSGALCIHPKQVTIVNDTYRVSDDELNKARLIVETYESAIKEGIGAIEIDGKMIDAPVYERAQQVVNKASALKQ